MLVMWLDGGFIYSGTYIAIYVYQVNTLVDTCINTLVSIQHTCIKCIYTSVYIKLHLIYTSYTVYIIKFGGKKKKFRLPSDFSTSMESKITVKHHCLEPKGERLCENCGILSQILSILQVLRL